MSQTTEHKEHASTSFYRKLKPNGCGKSSILEAIASVKEYVATYDPNQGIFQEHFALSNRSTSAWRPSVPLPIRADRTSATINLTLALNTPERVVVGGADAVEIGIVIHRTREIIPILSHPQSQMLLKNYDQQSGVGIFDYISADRLFPIQQLKNLDRTQLSLDAQRRERVAVPGSPYSGSKFASLKQFIIAQQLSDLSETNTNGGKHDSLTLLKELFNHFFGPKQLIGYKEGTDEYQVIVRTPYGDHDIDQLSSGEKELFAIFTNLFRIRNFPAVILYDEPERHLNSGLEAKLIPALDRLQTQNQLWISTHGIELIDSVPMQEIVALKREAGISQPLRFLEESKTERVRLFEQVGARVGVQLASNRIVFLEGENATADKRILDRLAGPLLPGVLFIAGGSSDDVLRGGTRAGLLLEEASKDTAFIMVIDRDYRDESNIQTLIKKLSNRVFVWRCHEVENLLLDKRSVWKVLQFNGITDAFASEEAVQDALLSSAKSLETRFAVEWATYRLHAEQNNSSSGSPRDEQQYTSMVQSRLERMTSAYSEDRATTLLQVAKAAVSKCFSDGTWLTVLPGKEIVEAFRKEYIPQLRDELFREQIISAMREQGIIPDEVTRLCGFINTR